MRHTALIVLCAMLAAIAPVKVQSKPDPSGAYRCDGISPDGRNYRAAVQIVRNEDTYIVKWLTPRGVVNVGVGFVARDTLSVGYIGSTAGVVVYHIDGNQLTGEWTDLDASGHVYKETLTKLKDGEKIVLPERGPTF